MMLLMCLKPTFLADSLYYLPSLFIFVKQAAIGRDPYAKELRPNNLQCTESCQQQWKSVWNATAVKSLDETSVLTTSWF